MEFCLYNLFSNYYRMVNLATTGNIVILGIIVVLVIIAAFVAYGGSFNNNFILMLSFLLIIIVIAIPFLQINLAAVGMHDTKPALHDSILNSILTTTGIFIAFLLITFLNIRRHPDQVLNYLMFFTVTSFFCSLLAITISTLRDSNSD